MNADQQNPVRKAYLEGYDAYTPKLDNKNPYKKGKEANAWNEGWLDAKEDFYRECIENTCSLS